MKASCIFVATLFYRFTKLSVPVAVEGKYLVSLFIFPVLNDHHIDLKTLKKKKREKEKELTF